MLRQRGLLDESSGQATIGGFAVLPPAAGTDFGMTQHGIEQLVEQIHASPGRVVLALSGGGSRAIAELLEVPGASRTVLEAVVPYSQRAVADWLGGRPEAFCSAQTTRAMAMVAFLRARECREPNTSAAGVASTASLATDRPKRGPHRAHVALQTASLTAAWSVQFDKERRTRADEEQLVSRMLLNTVGSAEAMTT